MNSSKNSWERHRGPRNRMEEWRGVRDKPIHNDRNKPIRNDEWVTSQAYLAARYKANRDKAYAYIVIGCAIAIIGILLMWP